MNIHSVVFDKIGNNKLSVLREDLLPWGFGGNKLRIANIFIEDMQKHEANLMISYGNIRSNLSRAISAECKSKKIPVWIISPTDKDSIVKNTFNRLLSELSHAKIIECEKDNVCESVKKTLAYALKFGYKPYYIYGNENGEGNEAVPVKAYFDVWSNQFLQYDYIFLATGTGMTQAGLVCGQIIKTSKVGPSIIGLSIAREVEVVKEKLKKYIKSFLGKSGYNNIIDDSLIYVYDARFGGYGCYNKEIEDNIVKYWEVNGIGMDPIYTGKAFTAMIHYIYEYNIMNANILFIHTGGSPLFFDWIMNRVQY